MIVLMLASGIMGIIGAGFFFHAGGVYKNLDEDVPEKRWALGTMGVIFFAMAVVLASMVAQYEVRLDMLGTPRQLQLGVTYDVISTDQVYMKLRGSDGIAHVYEIEIDPKLVPGGDVKLVERFTYDEQKKFVIVLEDPKPEK